MKEIVYFILRYLSSSDLGRIKSCMICNTPIWKRVRKVPVCSEECRKEVDFT